MVVRNLHLTLITLESKVIGSAHSLTILSVLDVVLVYHGSALLGWELRISLTKGRKITYQGAE
ncbi:hypothetical protein SNOG_13249 [Parastagonospora nodorum SN15]|uniref:Uncharacterized protein n=1 Tax=Phaeosphaeria nodorum (strain SN15 / ATCC MYA-4574 / FGSC 10173) TaxID=321614 RepID=Q0U4R5_PHANO|nr:hypothetical protein SNOG_13249 [Parastagonospora nodorum SN15]EAT79576.1 hypothetical protein SNOG_13249 [Parastagonospora nodorum SN15]